MIRLLTVPLALGALASCYGHYHAARRPVSYDHYHRLDCDHLVECRYRDGRHRYRAHRSHDRYWHVHEERGRYYRCYVDGRGHGR